MLKALLQSRKASKISYRRCIKHKNTTVIYLAIAFSSLFPFWKEKSIRQFLYLSFLSHFKTPTTLTGKSRTCFVLDKAEKRLTFWLQRKPAGEADCLLMVREGQQELILAIILQSLSSFLPQASLPAPTLSGRWGVRRFSGSQWIPGGREIILR